MGSLVYDSSVIEFDDRVLAHLQVVIVNKLRRRESFAMSWRDCPEVGDGRSTIWLDPSIPLYFKFEGSRVPAINRDWIERLAESANSSTGLIVFDEDGEPQRAGRTVGPAFVSGAIRA
ncbi:ATP-dependent DNA ligase [Leifsonia sp. McL0607]|uniref:DUF7882 family protein n=1 Tax=Leifsonia sp. McL0607 TaxID=3415672 RepID=UPI003CE8564B